MQMTAAIYITVLGMRMRAGEESMRAKDMRARALVSGPSRLPRARDGLEGRAGMGWRCHE